jgi:hypothetical protein
MSDMKINRPTLGPFMSVICFRYLNDDAEELAGRALIVDAGRHRGRDVIEELGLMGSHESAEALQKQLDDTLGVNGTRLCIIKSVTEKDDGGFEVHADECASPAYTMGVLIGAISAITGQTMLGKEFAQDGGGSHTYHIDPLG